MNRELLEKPFPADQIKQRKGGFGEMLDYIEGSAIIQRLNEAFQAEWSFRVQDHRIYDNEVVVLGELTAQGITKTQFGAKDITRAKADGKEVSIGDDLKAATTDSLKKCATLFGVGLHLYFDEQPGLPVAAVKAPNGNGNGNGHGESDSGGRLTAKQLSAIFALAKQKGWSNKQIREFTQEMFGKVPDFLTRKEASAVITHLQGGDHAN
jgi:Rad52/22 family double-strand break repair protein